MGSKIPWGVQVPTNPSLWWMFSCCTGRYLHQVSQDKCLALLVCHAGCGYYWNLCVGIIFIYLSNAYFLQMLSSYVTFFNMETRGLTQHTAQKLVHVINCGWLCNAQVTKLYGFLFLKTDTHTKSRQMIN